MRRRVWHRMCTRQCKVLRCAILCVIVCVVCVLLWREPHGALRRVLMRGGGGWEWRVTGVAGGALVWGCGPVRHEPVVEGPRPLQSPCDRVGVPWKSGFFWGGGSKEPPSTRAVREKGSIDRTVSQLFFLSTPAPTLKLVNFFVKHYQIHDFFEPPRWADSRNPIFIFCRLLGSGHLRGSGVSLGRILGGPSIEPFGGGGV